MLFSNNTKSLTNKIKIGNEEIEQKPNVKFLGITIDEHLKWKDHIACTKNKISKIVYRLKMVKNTLPQKSLKILYETLVQPHLDYGITFWGATHEIHIKQLSILQKKIIRNITNSKYNEHTKN